MGLQRRAFELRVLCVRGRRYARRIPSSGPAGFTLFAAGAAIMAYGFYQACCCAFIVVRCWCKCTAWARRCCMLLECVTRTACAQVGQHNQERRVLKREKMDARRALVPVLQAEEDRRCEALLRLTCCDSKHLPA